MRTSRSRTGPRSFPSHASSARRASVQAGSTSVPAARSSARARRVATLAWWTASGSAPSLTPGSFVSNARYWATSRERRRSIGSSPTGSDTASACASTRASFGVPSVGRAPALRSCFPIRPSVFPAPLTTSASSSANLPTVLAPSRTATSSSTTSIRSAPRVTVETWRRVRSLATASRSAPPRSNAGSRSRRGAGTRPGPPRSSSSKRPSAEGSFSCQRPTRCSTRRRSVIPQSSSRRPGVS